MCGSLVCIGPPERLAFFWGLCSRMSISMYRGFAFFLLKIVKIWFIRCINSAWCLFGGDILLGHLGCRVTGSYRLRVW